MLIKYSLQQLLWVKLLQIIRPRFAIQNLEEKKNSYTPDFYIHNRDKRFIQAITLINDIVGTFMGTFNAFEILQSKCALLNTQKSVLASLTVIPESDPKSKVGNIGGVKIYRAYMSPLYQSNNMVINLVIKLSH